VQEDRAYASRHHTAGHEQELDGPDASHLLDEGETDPAIATELVVEAGDEKEVVWRAPICIELVIGVAVAGRVELIGAVHQLLRALEIPFSRRRYRESHGEGREKTLLSSNELELGLLPHSLGAIHLPATRGIVGDEGRRKLRTCREPGGAGGIEDHQFRQGLTDFLALKGVVIDERDGVGADVDGLDDGLDVPGLRAPIDLRIEKVVREAEASQLLQRQVVIVSARDGMQDAPPIERAQDLGYSWTKLHAIALEKRSLPEGVVQVPDQELDRRRFRAGHGASTTSEFRESEAWDRRLLNLGAAFDDFRDFRIP